MLDFPLVERWSGSGIPAVRQSHILGHLEIFRSSRTGRCINSCISRGNQEPGTALIQLEPAFFLGKTL